MTAPLTLCHAECASDSCDVCHGWGFINSPLAAEPIPLPEDIAEQAMPEPDHAQPARVRAFLALLDAVAWIGEWRRGYYGTEET